MKLNNALQEQIGFTANETHIANYILAHKDEILQLSIQSLAKKTFTSTSAIMRLCHKLGLSGFKEFKICYAQELSHPEQDGEIDPNFPFSKNDSMGQIASQLETLTIQSLKTARQTMSIMDVNRACNLIQQAEHTAIFGVGDAYLAGLTFQARMMRCGINFLATPVYGEQFHLAQTLHRKDCAILLSYSGTTASTLRCAKELKRNGVTTIGITADGQSSLAKLCSITLLLPSKEKKLHRIATFFSQACMEYYLNVIYSRLYVLNYDRLSQKNIDS